jgi:hypothetical protein
MLSRFEQYTKVASKFAKLSDISLYSSFIESDVDGMTFVFEKYKPGNDRPLYMAVTILGTFDKHLAVKLIEDCCKKLSES